MFIAYAVMAILLTVALLPSAWLKLIRDTRIVAAFTDRLGVPLGLYLFLAACEIAGSSRPDHRPVVGTARHRRSHRDRALLHRRDRRPPTQGRRQGHRDAGTDASRRRRRPDAANRVPLTRQPRFVYVDNH